MWDENDKNNYLLHKFHNLGQIDRDEFSEDIQKYASNANNKTFLEIGTWNGLGSTKAFSRGFALRDNTNDYIFYSLECNKYKCADAQKLYENNKNMILLNEVVWNEEPADFYEIFPQCKTNATFKQWNDIDIINMKLCDVFLNRKDLPEIFDVILLDGGEFTTYYEFQLLKNRCKTLMLDDVNSDKCHLIYKELISDPSWKILKKNNLRNGYLIAEKII